MVESQPSKLLVAGSIPVSRSRFQQFAATELSTVTCYSIKGSHRRLPSLGQRRGLYRWGHLQKTATLGRDCEILME